MARRNLSAKQLKYFGTKRQKAAARASRKKKRNRSKAKAHRPRTKPNLPSRKRRTAPADTAPRRRNRRNGSAKKRRVAKRKNTGALYALVNSARKKGKKMARPKKNRQRKRPAGSHKTKRMNRTKRRNPGAMGRPADWLALGAGAIAGGLGATSLPQMVLGSSNTGFTGYLGMAASTAIIAVAAHFVFKKNVMLTSGVIAGGAGALIKRVIGDYTPFGQYLNAANGTSGMGDYLSNFNFPVPQIIGGNGNTALGTPGTIPVSVAGAGTGAGRALMNV